MASCLQLARSRLAVRVQNGPRGLQSLAHALLKAETLDAPDAYAAAGVPMRTAELEVATLARTDAGT